MIPEEHRDIIFSVAIPLAVIALRWGIAWWQWRSRR